MFSGLNGVIHIMPYHLTHIGILHVDGTQVSSFEIQLDDVHGHLDPIVQ